MNIAVGDMKVMIPMDNVQKVGLRDVIEKGSGGHRTEILTGPMRSECQLEPPLPC